MTSRTAALLMLLLASTAVGCGSQRTDDAAKSSLAVPIGPSWAGRPGYVYDINLASQAKLPSGNGAFALELKGELLLEVVESSPQGIRVWARVDKPQMTLGGKVDAEARKIADELGEPVLLVLDRGRVRDTWFSPAARAVTVSTWRSILSALQLSERSGSQDSWQSEEYDSTGRYRAAYSRNADGSILRTKQSYLAMLEAPGIPGARQARPGQTTKAEPEIIQATARYVVKHAVLETVDVKESVRTKLGDQSTLTVETTLALRVRPNISPPKLALEVGGFVARAVHLSPERAPPRETAVKEAGFDNLRMEGKKFSDIVAQFEQAAREELKKRKDKQSPPGGNAANGQDPEALRENSGAFSSLTAFLRSDPNARTEALAKIRAKSPAASMLVNGFGSAGTPPAQAVLVELLGDGTLPTAIRSNALISVGQLTHPEASVIPALIAQLKDPALQRQALLSLGSVSRRFRDVGRDQDVAAIRPELARGLEQATTTEERALALRAIANSGDAALFPKLKPFLTNDADVKVRGAAAEALRHMKLPEVNAILAERLASESNSEAAQAVMRAIRTRGAAPEFVPAVTRVIEAGSTPNVRQRAIELARSWLSEHPELRAVLAAAAEKDPDPQVRSAAAKAI